MTEPIQWGGELPDNDLSTVHNDCDYFMSVYDIESLRESISRQIRLIGQFWTDVDKLYRRGHMEDMFGAVLEDRYEWGKAAGRFEALKDILELSKKYPFG